MGILVVGGGVVGSKVVGERVGGFVQHLSMHMLCFTLDRELCASLPFVPWRHFVMQLGLQKFGAPVGLAVNGDCVVGSSVGWGFVGGSVVGGSVG